MQTENPQPQPSFYIAAIIYQGLSDAPDEAPLYEESLVLITATSDEEAHEKAARYVNETHSYKNMYGNTITWSLKHIARVQSTLTDEFIDGKEIYSRFFLDYEAYHSAFLTPFPDD